MLPPGALLQTRYRIVRLCDHSVVSSLYEAIDQRFGSTVLVKVWSPESGELTHKAFERETRLMNGLYHPALAHVFDTFAEGPLLVHVGEYVPGEFLSNVLALRRDPFDAREVLLWLDRLLSLLDYLHSRTPPIVHANIHPGALKITPRGDIVAVDLGLAVELPGSAIGYTLPYASYEQIQGRPLSGRSDIYSLAALAFHLLTMKPPPNASERMAGWANGAPVHLEHVDEINRKVDPAVGRVINHAMSLEPDDRPSNAADLRAELQGAVSYAAPSTLALEVEVVTDEDSESPTVVFPDTDDDLYTTGDDLGVSYATIETPVLVLGPEVDEDSAPVSDGAFEFPSDDVKRQTKIICRTCNAANDSERTFCPFCGARLRTVDHDLPVTERVAIDKIPCPTCGAENSVDAAACRMCATEFSGSAPPASMGVNTTPNRRADIDSMDGTVPLTPDVVDLPSLGVVTGNSARQDFVFDGALAASLAVPKALARLRVLDGEDVGRELNLRTHEMFVGRSEGDYTFPMDIFMSGRHARVIHRNNRFFLIDNESRNGTFVRINSEVDLHDGDKFLIGKQQFRFDLNGNGNDPKLIEILYSGTEGNTFAMRLPETVIGRCVGDIQFPGDAAMADAHTSVRRIQDHFAIKDLGSKNGTYLRISHETELRSGDIVIMGRHIFQFEIDEVRV